MSELTTIKELIKRGGMAAFAIAILLSLSATQAQAQGISGPDFQFQGIASVGLARGSTIRVHYDTGYGNRITIRGTAAPIAGADASVTEVGALAGRVNVFSASTGALLQSHELTSLADGLPWIDINRDDLREEGDPRTGRIQLWIQVVIDPCSASGQEAEECGVRVSAPTFEVVDNDGRTTVSGPIAMKTMKKAWKDS
jgi:hypothetical protein